MPEPRYALPPGVRYAFLSCVVGVECGTIGLTVSMLLMGHFALAFGSICGWFCLSRWTSYKIPLYRREIAERSKDRDA